MDNTRVELERIRDILKSNQKGLTIAEIAKLLNLNRISTSKYLNMLVASGLAEMRVHGPSKVYYPCQRVPISSLLNFSKSHLLVMNNNLTIIDANNAVLNFFLLEKKDLIGHRIDYSPIAGYIDTPLISRIQSALESHGSVAETKVQIRGEEFFFNIQLVPTAFETGEPGVTLIAEDVTEITRYRLHLEQLVDERSSELTTINDQLRKEIENHKKARKAVKTSEIKYRELVQNANSIILKMDTEGTIVFINEFAQSFFGFTEPEIIGRNIIGTLLPPWDSNDNDIKQQIGDILRNPEEFPTNINENIRKDGGRIWISWTNKRILDAQDRLTGVLSIGNDITQLKRAEDELKFRNVLLATQQETTIDGILVVDEKGAIISYNQRFIELWGIPREIIEQQDDTIALQYVHDKVAEPARFLEKITSLYNHRDEISHENVLLKGGRIFERYSAPMVGPDKKYYGRVWYFRDTTEQKIAEQNLQQSEQKLSAIIGFLPDATFVIDTDGIVIAWNRAMEDLTGVKEEDILGLGNYEYAVAYHGERKPIMIDLALDSNLEIPGRYNYCRREGDKVFAEMYYQPPQKPEGGFLWGIAAPLYDATGKIIGAIESTRDITARKRSELALKEREEQYQAIIEDQTEMICRFLPDGTYTFVNGAYSSFFNTPKDRIIGIKFKPAIFDGDRDLLQNSECIGRIKPVVTIEIRMIPEEGDVRWTRWNIRGIYSPEGMLMEYQAVGRDVTKYVSAKETRDYQAQILNQITDAIIATDMDNRITYWNPTAEKMYGNTYCEVLGKDFSTIITADIPQKDQDKIRADVYERGEWRGDLDQVTKTGRRLRVDWSLSMMRDQAGKPIGKLGVGREIVKERRPVEKTGPGNGSV